MQGMKKYIIDNGLEAKMKNASHIAWATGGSMVPEDIREKYRNTYLED
jgi:D-serine dehydratase